MLLKNAKVVLPDGVKITDVRVCDGFISQIGTLDAVQGEQITDLTGKYLFAGLIDSHTHGAVKNLYSDENCDLDAILKYEAENGVTTVAATLHTLPVETTLGCIRHNVEYMKKQPKYARIGGIHIEGPFLNIAKKGAMKPENLQVPSVETFDKFYDACEGTLCIMTIAPEMTGALDVIRRGVQRGVNMSSGHTDASYEEEKAAVEAGLTRMTHTFNACRALNHREPGVLGFAFTDDRVTCEVITDFRHVNRAMVDLVYRLKRAKNFCAISDSEFCAGLEEGSVNRFDGRDLYVKDGLAYLENGTIAGSASSLLIGIENLASLGISLEEISVMVSLNPAKAMNIADKTGSIEVGKWADFAVLDENYHIEKTYVFGNEVYSK